MRTVLLVEDNDDSRRMYADYLTGVGFRVFEATNAVDALALAPTVHIIVADIGLSGPSDGLDLTRRIRRDPLTGQIPVILLTAYGPAARQRGIDAGCTSFLSKPCLPDELAAEIQRLLGADSKT